MDLHILVADKLHVSQLYALTAKKTNHRLSIKKKASKITKVIFPLYAVLVRPYLGQSPSFGVQEIV